MKKFRLHITRFIILIIALQILNLGLFAQDFPPLVTTAVTPEINIINSVDEYIAEVVLHHKDAVPENNNNPQKDLQAHKHIDIKLISFPKPQYNLAARIYYHNKFALPVTAYSYLFSNSIYPPPPKA